MHTLVIFRDNNGKWCAPLEAINGRTGEVYPGHTAHRFTGEVDADGVPWYEGDEGFDKYGRPFVVGFSEGCFWQKYVDKSVIFTTRLLTSSTHTPPVKKYKRLRPLGCPVMVEDERVSDRRTGTKRPERKTGRMGVPCMKPFKETDSDWPCNKPIGRRNGPMDRRHPISERRQENRDA